MTILVDMDDVLDDLLPAWVDWINKHHGYNVQVEDVHTFYMPNTFRGLSMEDIYRPLVTQEFWEGVKPKPGAVDGLKTLVDKYTDVYIVTASTVSSMIWKCGIFLEKYFPYFDWNNIITAKNKSMIKGDVIIDDYPPNLRGERGLKLLMDAPHNRADDIEKLGVRRVRSWKEILDAVKMYEKIHENEK